MLRDFCYSNTLAVKTKETVYANEKREVERNYALCCTVPDADSTFGSSLQSGADPATKDTGGGEGAISVTFGGQVSLRVHYCMSTSVRIVQNHGE